MTKSKKSPWETSLIDSIPNNYVHYEDEYTDGFSEYLINLGKKRLIDKKEALDKKSLLQIGVESYFLDLVQKKIVETFPTKLEVPKQVKRKFHPKKRKLNLLLSDLHLHSMLDGKSVSAIYKQDEEARSVAHIINQACLYKQQYRHETELNIHFIGDLIEGKIHDVQFTEPLAKQCAAAISTLFQGIYYASQNFEKIEVWFVSGNHDRNPIVHSDRASLGKWDSFGTIIAYAIKTALKPIKNVKINIPLTPYYTCDVFGAKAFFTHGDNVINVGNPGKNVNIKNIQIQIDAWNNKFDSNSDRCRLFAVGHVHTAMDFVLPNGVQVMINGALIPPNSHAESSGYFQGNCGQWLWESVPGYLVGDRRFINVTNEHRNDKELDNIIQPFDGF